MKKKGNKEALYISSKHKIALILVPLEGLIFLVGVGQKSIPRRPRNAFSKYLKRHFCMCLCISVRKIFFQWPGKFLSGGRLNNFLKAACCLGLAKSFKFFHFIDDFVDFISFQYFHQQHWNAEIFQKISASRVRLRVNFSWKVTFSQYKIILQ